VAPGGFLWRGQARGLRGVALLRVGRLDEARQAWLEIIEHASAHNASIDDQDLYLAWEMIEARQCLDEVEEYLGGVAQRAASTDSYDLPQRCATVRARLDLLKNSSS